MKIILAFAMILFAGSTIFSQGKVGTVTTKTVTISVADKSSADSKEATKFLGDKAVYDNTAKTLRFPLNEVGPDYSWRLVHDGKTVIDFEYTHGVTGTVYNIFEGTYDDCLKQIDSLRLVISDEQKNMAASQLNNLPK